MAEREPRLIVARIPHRGLPAALNEGLARASAALVARHDADDLSHRRRFEWQRALHAADPALAVAGGRVRLFPDAATGVGMRRWARWHNALLTHDEIASEVLIDSPLAHGAAMIRRDWLARVGGWQERGWPEDLDLWVRLLRAGARFGKRPEVLYSWRQHRGSATRRDPRYRRQRFIELKLDSIRRDFLRGRGRVAVAGVGESLDRAAGAIASLGVSVRRLEAGRPEPAALARLERPAILIFMSPVARRRWREALTAAGWVEREDFLFVA
jgi:glycosyltransferase involved in cell wall biosynthesis